MTSARPKPALANTIAVHAHGEVVRRNAKLWGRFKRFLKKTPDAVERAHTRFTAVHLVDSVKEVLAQLGVTNAVALEVDGAILFEDSEGRPDDLAELFAAFDAQADETRALQSLRLTVEHTHAGLRFVITVEGFGQPDDDEATVTVGVLAEVPTGASTYTMAQLAAFEDLLAQIHASLVDAMPEMRVSELAPSTIERPAAVSTEHAEEVGDDFEWDPDSLYPAAEGDV